MSEALITVDRMKRDIRQAAATLSRSEARYLVDCYYQMQDDRIKAANRLRAMQESGEPHSVIDWLQSQASTLEAQIKGALDVYSRSHPVGEWMRSVKGIGPVLAAGFLANIDITRRNENNEIICTSAGKLWAYCGLAPGRDKRIKGQKLTFNPSLKRLAFLAGECFKRQAEEDEDAFYRRIYSRRKAYETANSEAGKYRDQAELALQKKYGAETVARKFYEQGKLPPGHIDRRSARYAAKLFLAHLFEVMWRHEFGTEPPLPYPIQYLGHVDRILVPQPAATSKVKKRVAKRLRPATRESS